MKSTWKLVHSVNAVIDLWRKHGEEQAKAIEAAVILGGDTDSVAAMLGGILGADPTTTWPEEWLRVRGWPTVGDIDNMPGRVGYWHLAGNHLLQLPVILAYGFRRLFPPY